MFANMEFANPGYLYLLIIIPLVGLWYWYKHVKDSADIQVSSTKGFITGKRSLKQYLYFSLYFMRAMAMALLIVALARPQTTSSRQDVTIEGIDIVIALDVSGSMLAMDLKPDRLEAAKEVAS